jgi:hypothetical protein
LSGLCSHPTWTRRPSVIGLATACSQINNLHVTPRKDGC